MSFLQTNIIDDALDNLLFNIKKTDFDNACKIKVVNNEIILPSEFCELQNSLSPLISIFPEFLKTIGRLQHKTHKYTLDIHMLKAVQECVLDWEFQHLSVEDKRVLLISAFLHDIEKDEGVVDKFHPQKSAVKVKTLLSDKALNSIEKERIIRVINNHHWVQDLSKEEKTHEQVVSQINNSNDFRLLKILARADLKAIGNDELYERLKNSWAVQAEIIEKHLG